MNSFLFHEPRQHGTPDFPFEYYYVDKSHPRYNMPFHWHKEWEIIHVLEGTFTAHADNTVYTAHPGDLLLIRDGMLHGGTPDDCIYECFLFDLHGLYRNLDMVKKHLRPIYRQQTLPDIYYPVGKSVKIDHIISELSAICRSVSASDPAKPDLPLELSVLGAISLFFATILNEELCTANQIRTAETTHKIDLIKSVFEFIELHYAHSVTLNDLSAVANMNPSYFCRFFRSITHQSPMEYVNMYRIEKAAQMLHSTGLPVTNICMECGFNECSNFIKVFKKYKGMTPKQYRDA
ncbi:MAG: helix-turn-helix transcriptional regulator [Lachnospiraceae bacterium]|nr:helix-turn-helix transcriptional regulator [Lachnospiraceae bacterium]